MEMRIPGNPENSHVYQKNDKMMVTLISKRGGKLYGGYSGVRFQKIHSKGLLFA